MKLTMNKVSSQTQYEPAEYMSVFEGGEVSMRELMTFYDCEELENLTIGQALSVYFESECNFSLEDIECGVEVFFNNKTVALTEIVDKLVIDHTNEVLEIYSSNF